MSNYDELKAKAARFLSDQYAKDFGGELSYGEHSLEEMMRLIEARAKNGSADCERFLEEEVPWEDLEVPDPLGWANQG